MNHTEMGVIHQLSDSELGHHLLQVFQGRLARVPAVPRRRPWVRDSIIAGAVQCQMFFLLGFVNEAPDVFLFV